MTLRRTKRDPEGRMALLEHLGEFRKRLVICVAAIMGGTIAGWFLYHPVFNVLSNPFCEFMQKHPNLAANPKNPCSLYYTSVVEPFMIRIKVAVFTGLVVASPVILYQLWRFVVPALHGRERKFAIPFVFSAILLFALGGWFAMLTLPKGLGFLLGFAGTT